MLSADLPSIFYLTGQAGSIFTRGHKRKMHIDCSIPARCPYQALSLFDKNKILLGKEFWVMGFQCGNMESSSIPTSYTPPKWTQRLGMAQEEILMLQNWAQLFKFESLASQMLAGVIITSWWANELMSFAKVWSSFIHPLVIILGCSSWLLQHMGNGVENLLQVQGKKSRNVISWVESSVSCCPYGELHVIWMQGWGCDFPSVTFLLPCIPTETPSGVRGTFMASN